MGRSKSGMSAAGRDVDHLVEHVRSETTFQYVSHPARRRGHIVVFPDTNDCPTGCPELCVGVSIAAPVVRNLLRPVPRVCIVTTSAMLRTTVPEATVDEYGDFCSCEDDVDTPPFRSGHDWQVNAVAQAPPVQLLSKPQLRHGVSARQVCKASMCQLA